MDLRRRTYYRMNNILQILSDKISRKENHGSPDSDQIFSGTLQIPFQNRQAVSAHSANRNMAFHLSKQYAAAAAASRHRADRDRRAACSLPIPERKAFLRGRKHLRSLDYLLP